MELQNPKMIQCYGSVTFWYGSGFADPYLLLIRLRILLFSSVTFTMATKKLFLSFFAFFFLKLHLHHFSRIKSHKDVQNSRSPVFLTIFFLMIEGSGSGSVPYTNGAGSGSSRTKNIRIRIRNNAIIILLQGLASRYQGNTVLVLSEITVCLLAVLRIRIRIILGRWILIRIKVESRIQIRIKVNSGSGSASK